MEECKYLVIETWPGDNDHEMVIRKVMTFAVLQKWIAHTSAQEMQCRHTITIQTIPN